MIMAHKINPKPQGADMTPEQTKEMAARAFLQKRNAIAEMVLSQSCSGAGDLDADKGVRLVDTALAMADYYMKKAFGIQDDANA